MKKHPETTGKGSFVGRWWKHLRPENKRRANKGTRRVGKQEIVERLDNQD